MVNIVTGNSESGNDIRQSLNNINHSGEYSDSLFSAFFNSLVLNSDENSVPENSSFGGTGKEVEYESTPELQADLSALIIPELHPLLNNSKNTDINEITGDASQSSLKETNQLIEKLIASNPGLKEAASEYIQVNQPLPKELQSLLKDTVGTEDYGILKEALNKSDSFQTETGAIQVSPDLSGKTDDSLKQMSGLLNKEPNTELNLKDTRIIPAEGSTKQEQAVNPNTAGDNNYYKFEPRLRQISSNFSSVSTIITNAETEIPNDNNMSFISGFIAGRQSYNKSIDKAVQAETPSKQQIISDKMPFLLDTAEVDGIEEIIDFANPQGMEKLKEAISENSRQVTPNFKSQEKTIVNQDTTNILNELDTPVENTDEPVLPKTNIYRVVTEEASSNSSDKSLPKTQAQGESTKDALPDFTNGQQGMNADSDSSKGQKTALQSDAATIKDIAKQADSKSLENEFAGLIRQQKADGSKNKARAAETKPGTSQELQRIRLSEFPTAAVRIVKGSANNTVSTARLSLRPESLGTVDVKITMAGDTVSLSINADSREAVKSLEGQIGALRDKLAQEGLKTDSIEINYSDESKPGGNQAKDSYGGNEQREYNETMRDFIDSFGDTGEDSLAGINNIDNGIDSGSNKVYIGQDSSFVQYV